MFLLAVDCALDLWVLIGVGLLVLLCLFCYVCINVGWFDVWNLLGVYGLLFYLLVQIVVYLIGGLVD